MQERGTAVVLVHPGTIRLCDLVVDPGERSALRPRDALRRLPEHTAAGLAPGRGPGDEGQLGQSQYGCDEGVGFLLPSLNYELRVADGRYAAQMEARRAVESLKQLKGEADTRGIELRPSGASSSWKGRVRSVLIRSLGKDHHLVADFERIRYSLMAFSEGTPQSSFDAAFMRGIRNACGVIEAAIFELEESGTSDEAVDETAFDPDLWSHVHTHVHNEEWQKVASQTAIFVEDRVRKWCGEPRGNNGQALVGKGLFAAALANDAQYRLGKEPGEWEGWRALGMGFTQALSNVDRHNIQRRDDAKRYAFGVLGIGSLILTQLRHQHGEELDTD